MHGDDYVCTGVAEDLQWSESRFKSNIEMKTSVVGADAGDECEVRVLNRIIRVSDDGIWIEADQRHAETIVKQLNLEAAKPSRTTGAKEAEPEEGREE